MHRMGGPGMFFGMAHGLFTLALLTALVVVVIMIIKKKKGAHTASGFIPGLQPHQPPAGDAMRILDERLARGEIEIDDYVARRSVLMGGPGMDYHAHPDAPFGGTATPAAPAAPPPPAAADEPRPEAPSQ